MSEYKGAHDPRDFPGAIFRQGGDGDARQGTCYGHRDARTYNRIKIRQTELEEGRQVVLLHYARKLKNDDFITEFVVVNGHLDPGMRVVSRIPGTTLPGGLNTPDVFQDWPKFELDGRVTFLAPDSYKGGPISWFHASHLGDESLVYETDKSFLFLNNQGAQQDVGLTEVNA